MRLTAFVSLVALLALGLIVRDAPLAWTHSELPAEAATLMSVGIMLLGGWLTGSIFESLRLPKICGYLLFGMLIGPSPYTLGIIPKSITTKELSFINDLAVSLIALTAGGELKYQFLKGRLLQISKLVLVDSAIVLGSVALLIIATGAMIPFLSNQTFVTVAVVASLTSIVALANSPTVVIAMISDYKAKGPLSQTTLAFTVSKDLLLIILFALFIAVGKSALDVSASFSPLFLVVVGVQLLGSILIGALAGMLMAFYVDRVRAHLAIFVIGCCLLFALLGKESFSIGGYIGHLEPLLMALSAGMLMENVYPDRSSALFHRLEELSLPVYCMFFALAGAKVDLQSLAQLWYFSVILALFRAAVVWFGVNAGQKVAGISEPWSGKLWLGMLPQAGVSLVLVALIRQNFGMYEWGAAFSDMLIGMIVINELFGPVGFRWALFSSGEANAGQKKK